MFKESLFKFPFLGVLLRDVPRDDLPETVQPRLVFASQKLSTQQTHIVHGFNCNTWDKFSILKLGVAMDKECMNT